MREYQESEAYKEFLRRRRSKTQSVDSQFDSGDSQLALDDFDDEGISNELYCKVCDQFFNSLHNKKEHLYGRHHLQAIAGDFQKEALQITKSTGMDDESLNPCDFLVLETQDELHCRKFETTATENGDKAVDVDGAMFKFIELVQSRAEEITHLQATLQRTTESNSDLNKKLFDLQSVKAQKQEELKRLQFDETDLNNQLQNLRMVPALFGINNF